MSSGVDMRGGVGVYNGGGVGVCVWGGGDMSP